MTPFRKPLYKPVDLYGKIEYIRGKKRSLSGTFLVNERIVIELSVPRMLGACDALLSITSDDGLYNNSFRGSWASAEYQFDKYCFTIPKSSLSAGLYFYTIRISSWNSTYYSIPQYDRIIFTEQKPYEGHQITISDFKTKAPEKHYGGIIYQIFVDRFARSGKPVPKDGARIVDDWEASVPEYPEYPGAPLKNNTFYGGTLDGIIKKLPYITSLGVTQLYLSPIFESKSNHKYDTADYMKVDSMFGGDKALKRLLKAAKKLGVGIILDGVFNHTGDDSVYFNRYGRYDSVGAYQSKESPYYSWYDFKSHPKEYTCWWGIEILPRINPDVPSCRDFFVGKGGMLEKYAELGIAGLRLDVVDELSDDFISAIKETLIKHNPDAILYGEVWEDASNKIAYNKRKRYYQGSELDGVMNYPLRRGIIDFLKRERSDTLRYALTTVTNNTPKRILDLQMNLIGTHDTERIITTLSGESSYGKTNDYLSTKRMNDDERAVGKKLVSLAYTILATLPGIPMIFYGDEVGLEGYSDPFNRMPYPWGKEDREILAHFITVGKIRRKYSVYKTGDFHLLYLDESLLIFERKIKNESYVTCINNGDRAIEITSDSELQHLLGNCSYVEPLSSTIFKTKGNSFNIIRI